MTVHYGYDEKGRLTGERQTVHHPETEALLWQHETRHAYNAQGLANRCIPDSLPAVEWLAYGSGYLAGMKLGDTPLVDFTRDRLHRETLRSFGRYELTTAYTPAGQLQSQHLNSLQYDRDYTWNDNGELIRISSPRQTRSYSYSDSGRLTGVHTTAANLDIRIPYATDPAGNRLPDPELHPDSTLSMWPDNRIARDAHYLYRYDRHGRLTEKTDLIPEGVIRTDDERTHRYHYDSQHRLVHYTRTQYEEPLVESRYLYDPLGRRVAKRVWRRERDLTGWMSLSRIPQVTWYGWDGDRLTTIQNDRSRIQTIYQPGSFTPLIRVETATGELAKTQRRSLADALQQSGGEDGGSVVFPPVLVQMLDRLESEILADRVSEESRRWLASCGLTVEQMQNQMDPVYTPARKIHLYHCDHRGLPLALISAEGATEWCAEYDEWGNLLNEENPHQLQQLIRLPGQQYDEESGLYYNRHRYYDPLQGRYITQDPIGLKGGWNFYQYPLNPVINVDPQGLVDINLYPESDLIHSVADEINIPGVFTIGGHGTPTSIESATRSIMTAKDLAYLIKFDGNYKDGMTVWLFSCNTGKGQNSFASQLAKELHTNVIGPDTLWTWWGRGTNGKLKMDTVLTAPTNLNSNKDLMAITTKDLGNWITYGPSGHPISNMQGTPEKPSDIR
ncbi:RHS repeat protein [Escherichia coli]|nr:RHS repeat protein [Escherichia coli]EAC0074766.1 RHS repeat protein [Escherichia coli]EEV9029645.1 RHS repeat protein [Escherichia coli]EGD4889492.1 RHS repeat protein [Escherichia coli]MGP66640.1 RHS repeat protein [Escherichia coli]